MLIHTPEISPVANDHSRHIRCIHVCMRLHDSRHLILCGTSIAEHTIPRSAKILIKLSDFSFRRLICNRSFLQSVPHFFLNFLLPISSCTLLFECSFFLRFTHPRTQSHRFFYGRFFCPFVRICPCSLLLSGCFDFRFTSGYLQLNGSLFPNRNSPSLPDSFLPMGCLIFCGRPWIRKLNTRP